MIEVAFQLSEVERQKLIEQYQPYVRKLAKQTFQRLSGKFDYEDLVAYGTLGLIESAGRYDPQRGVSFGTFAHYRIKGAIFDGLKQMGLRPRTINRQVSRFEQNASMILQSAVDDEISENQVQSVEDEVHSIETLIDSLIPAYLLSLDSDEAKNAPDRSLVSAQEEIESAELIRLVREVVQDMPEQERELLEAIYYKQISMTDHAASKGITKSWVSRLHARAVQHIRDKLKEIGFMITEES
ncbi:MAG: sigma-70 family RNA polymerase sigma factor [Pyrinomonadaceae bacterium]